MTKLSRKEVRELNLELKPLGQKWCSRCGTANGLDDFSKAGYCNDCTKNQAKTWRLDNPERKSESNKRYRTLGPQDRRPVRFHTGKSEMAKFFSEVTALIEVSTAPDPEQDDVQTLYRFYDSSDVLLYIGITYTTPSRFRAHKYDKEWWGLVRKIELEQFMSREAVLQAERAAIKSELPLFNTKHSVRVA